MNKYVYIVIAIILICISAALFFRYKTQKSAVSFTLSEQEEDILLYPEGGDVFFQTDTGTEFQVATITPTVLPNKSVVRTASGTASVLFPDNSNFSISENTEISIEYTPKHTTLYQKAGTTYHRVEKLVTGATYEVSTEETVASVRGTKFAVHYDRALKKTKVAVTESKVAVSPRIYKKESTTEIPKEDSILLEVGNVLTVEGELLKRDPKNKTGAMKRSEVKNDDIRNYLDKEKKRDMILDAIRNDSGKKGHSTIELRKELRRALSKEGLLLRGEDKKNIETTLTDPVEKKSDIAPLAEPVAPVRNPILLPAVTPVAPVIMEEEAFFTAFEDLFMKNFYLDEKDIPCSIRVTPDARVAEVKEFAASKGYPFVKDSLLSFAREIGTYCTSKDQALREKLRLRFDAEYPFN